MKLIFDLLQQMAVFMVIAYLFSKSPAFRADQSSAWFSESV